jgi:hypothetical protein
MISMERNRGEATRLPFLGEERGRQTVEWRRAAVAASTGRGIR